MIRTLRIALLVAPLALAQDIEPKRLTFMLGDIGFQIYTQSSASKAPLSTTGSVIWDGGNVARRVVVDKSGHIVFGYDIEVIKHGDNAVVLRIKPAEGEANRKTPTLARSRQFPPLLPGDAVEIDILRNPATGERLYDVARVVIERPFSPKLPPDLFSLLEPSVAINGKVVRQANFWMTGGGLMVRVPGQGDYYMSLGPSAKYSFKPLGWVDHDTLRFQAGSDLVEIVGKGKVLKRSDFRTIWIYHDPDSVVSSRTFGKVDFTCGDDGDSLISLLKHRQ